MENKNQKQPSGLHKRKPTRRNRPRDRRRADLATAKRRKNYGDRRRVLGDRRKKSPRPPEGEPTNYDLKVNPNDDWDKGVREIKHKKRPS